MSWTIQTLSVGAWTTPAVDIGFPTANEGDTTAPVQESELASGGTGFVVFPTAAAQNRTIQWSRLTSAQLTTFEGYVTAGTLCKFTDLVLRPIIGLIMNIRYAETDGIICYDVTMTIKTVDDPTV